MLLTKPLTTFLHAQLAPQSNSHLHTLVLCTATGKLLSTASPLSAAVLRNRATLASQLVDLYSPLAADGTIANALPDSDSDSISQSRQIDHELRSVLVQLEHGVMVIVVLRCGLLFIAIGGLGPVLGTVVDHLRLEAELRPSSAENGVRSSAASDAGSTGTGMGIGKGSVRVVRRQAEELAKWLDGELDGFVLSGSL